MNNFRSFRIHDNEGRIEAGFESTTLDQLTAGEVVVAVEWSGINYKDALAATGRAYSAQTGPEWWHRSLAG